ncbi:MAG TPA: hypothetical protein VNE16_11435 [Vicinamibacterales bacterium]|nr:hypothetical protein [Vicinamibacterales bacterium]
MDTGLRSPLIDLFRRGEVAHDVRLLAARGAFAPRAIDQLALLALLVDDPDPAVAAAADQTLGRIAPGILAAFLARPDVPQGLRAFFAARGVEAAPDAGGDGDAPLIEAQDADAGIGEEAEADAVAGDDARQPAVQRLMGMTLTDKLKVALKGSREERAILIRDPNKMVAAAVLSSPRLGDDEIEGFARMATIAEDILRTIAANRAWTRNYGVILGLVRNPKTPLAVSLNLLARLNDRDVNAVSIDRNVPDPLRIAARRKVVTSSSRR